MDLLGHVKISFILISCYGLENLMTFEKVTFINYSKECQIIKL